MESHGRESNLSMVEMEQHYEKEVQFPLPSAICPQNIDCRKIAAIRVLLTQLTR